MTVRYDGRKFNELRPFSIFPNVFEYADGSVLLEMGKTKVLCAVTLQNGVPLFLRGNSTGWLTAEYGMLPASTTIRTPRETIAKRNGRSVEISRLIGRSLRTILNLKILPERTIFVDCDVLQADGGTRTASITGAYLALKIAQDRWLHSNVIHEPFLLDRLASISVGILNGEPILDPDFKEDSNGMADFNFILTSSGKMVEVQGGAEHTPIPWDLYEKARLLAMEGINKIFKFCDDQKKKKKSSVKFKKETSLFSLKNRNITMS